MKKSIIYIKMKKSIIYIKFTLCYANENISTVKNLI